MSVTVYLILSLFAAGYLGVRLFNTYKVKRRYRYLKEFKHVTEMDAAVNSKLSEIRYRFDASKAKLYQLSNTGSYFSNRSIKKISLTHFIVGVDVEPPDVTSLQNLPTSLYPNMMMRFLSHRGVLSWDANSAPDAFLRTRHKAEGVEWMVLTGIYCPNNSNLLGILALNYLVKKPIQQDDPALIEFASDLGKMLGN